MPLQQPSAPPGEQRDGAPSPTGASSDAYARLRDAGTSGKVDVLLDLIEAHADGRLVLPKRSGHEADLTNVNLSTEALGPRLSSDRAAGAPWWNVEENAFCLHGADLEGAMLRGAVLRGVDLREANLRGATLGGADLRGALMENADLSQADLVSTRLDEAQLGGANLDKALLENASLRATYLRFARLQYAALDEANLHSADLWGADLEGASLMNSDLREALLHETNAQDANLSEADLREADLRDAVLREAILREADLRGTDLDGADLQRAVLQRARLQGLLLTGCTLEHIHLSEAQLAKTRLYQRQVGGALGEELDHEYEAASSGYLALEQAFSDFGDPDAARWAYIKKRTMQKLTARQYAREAAGRGDWGTAVRNGLSYMQAKIVELICGYGESIPRTLASIFVVFAVFTVIYGLTGSVVRAEAMSQPLSLWPMSDLVDVATFGLVTMTSATGPEVSLHPSGDVAQTLASLHTLITIGLTGLLGYVLGNRIHK